MTPPTLIDLDHVIVIWRTLYEGAPVLEAVRRTQLPYHRVRNIAVAIGFTVASVARYPKLNPEDPAEFIADWEAQTLTVAQVASKYRATVSAVKRFAAQLGLPPRATLVKAERRSRASRAAVERERRKVLRRAAQVKLPEAAVELRLRCGACMAITPKFPCIWCGKEQT